MHQHVIYPTVPPAILAYLLPVSKATHIPLWGDLIEACAYLRTQFPKQQFHTEPSYYVDLQGQNVGFIFAESTTDDAYFIYQNMDL